jgi:hypothetical protein
VLGAIEFGYEHIKQILGLIDELVAKVGKPKVMGELHLPTRRSPPRSRSRREGDDRGPQDPGQAGPQREAVDAIKKAMLDKHFPSRRRRHYGEYLEPKARTMAKEAFRASRRRSPALIVEKGHPRRRPQAPGDPPHHRRGRRLRPHPRLGVLPARRDPEPRLLTLGTGKDEQIIDGLLPEYSKKFTSTTTSRPSPPAR